LKLGDIEREIFFADLVESPDNAVGRWRNQKRSEDATVGCVVAGFDDDGYGSPRSPLLARADGYDFGGGLGLAVEKGGPTIHHLATRLHMSVRR
jgi:hypothetical protein